MNRFFAITFGILALLSTLFGAIEARRTFNTFRNPVVIEDYFADFNMTPDLTLRNGETLSNRTDGSLEIRSNSGPVTLTVGSPTVAAFLKIYDEVGQAHYLWVATDATVRISGSLPEETLTDGVAVGSQS